jgi:FtsH-binding integral membrane protein
MKSIIFFALVGVAAFLLLAKPQVSFSPFSVRFEALGYAIGWLMIIVGVSLISYDSEKRARREVVEEISNVIQQINNEDDQEQQDTRVQESQ